MKDCGLSLISIPGVQRLRNSEIEIARDKILGKTTLRDLRNRQFYLFNHYNDHTALFENRSRTLIFTENTRNEALKNLQNFKDQFFRTVTNITPSKDHNFESLTEKDLQSDFQRKLFSRIKYLEMINERISQGIREGMKYNPGLRQEPPKSGVNFNYRKFKLNADGEVLHLVNISLIIQDIDETIQVGSKSNDLFVLTKNGHTELNSWTYPYLGGLVAQELQ
jgi:hypothetical protein